MGEIIPEPLLTNLINDCDSRMLDIYHYVDTSDGDVRWRDEPVIPDDFSREITPRDATILNLDVVGFDSIQFVLSRRSEYGNLERETLKTRHLALAAVKQYLKERYHHEGHQTM